MRNLRAALFVLICFQAEEHLINRVADLQSSGTAKNRKGNQKPD